MKKYFYAPAILSVFLCNNSCFGQQIDTTRIFSSLLQCWHAVSHEYSSIYGLEESEIKSYSKQKVCFSRDSITMYYGVVYTPKYSIKKVNADDFARDNFDCSKDKLGMLKDSIYEINISSMSRSLQNGAMHKMTDVVAFDGDFLYIVKDGVIFKLFNKEGSGVRNSN